jgi:hypothetical protein
MVHYNAYLHNRWVEIQEQKIITVILIAKHE